MVDLAKALDAVGDEESFKMMAEDFLATAPNLMALLKKGVQDQCPELVEQSAHKLKALLGFFFADDLAEQLQVIEDRGHNSDLEGVAGLVVTVDKGLERALKKLTEA